MSLLTVYQSQLILQGAEVSEEFINSCGMTSALVARLGLCRELEVTGSLEAFLTHLCRVTLAVLTAFSGVQEGGCWPGARLLTI